MHRLIAMCFKRQDTNFSLLMFLFIFPKNNFFLERNMHHSQPSIVSFLWKHIKPYKWLYLVMLSAPICGSFYVPVYNYSIKLFLNTMVATNALSYGALTLPIILFVGAHFAVDLIWRVGNIAEWRAEPFVRRAILLETYQYVQDHSIVFFQNHLSGTI